MGRFSESQLDEDGETGIDMSPLIDCVFILLIFFIVTTVFVEETGVEVDKPQAASAVNLEKTSVLIAVTEKGAVVYGGRDVGVNGVQAIVKRLRDGDPSVVDEAADLIEEFIDKLECQGRRSCGCDKTGGNPHGPSK